MMSPSKNSFTLQRPSSWSFCQTCRTRHHDHAGAEGCGPACRRQCRGTCRDGEALLYRLERKRARESGLQICAPENWSPPFIVRLCIIGRQTVVRPGNNPVPSLLFRSHPRDVFLVCALSNIELRMTLMCKSKNCFLPQ